MDGEQGTSKEVEGQKNNEGAQQQGNKANDQQQQQTNENTATKDVDLKKAGDDAVNKFLSDLGFENSDSLKGLVEKARAEEQAKLSDSERKDLQIETLTKKLAQKTKDCALAESKLAAIKLGAKPELVDDLVAVAMSRVSKDKDVATVISEIKEGNTGSIYFGDEVQDQQSGVFVTRGKSTQEKRDKQDSGSGKAKGFSFARDIAKSQEGKQKRKTYFS